MPLDLTDKVSLKTPGQEIGAYFEEGKVGWTIEEVCETDESVPCLHVEQENTSKERHALDVANVWTIACIRPKDVTKRLVVRTTLPCGVDQHNQHC